MLVASGKAAETAFEEVDCALCDDAREGVFIETRVDADEVGWVVIRMIAFAPGVFVFTAQVRWAHFIALEKHMDVVKIEAIGSFDLVKN